MIKKTIVVFIYFLKTKLLLKRKLQQFCYVSQHFLLQDCVILTSLIIYLLNRQLTQNIFISHILLKL